MGARICDFCSVRAGVLGGDPLPVWWPSALAVLGSPGYVDPHYLRSGFVTKNSSVYNFGVLLLELPTGICRDLRVQDNKETESSQSTTAYQMLDTTPHHKLDGGEEPRQQEKRMSRNCRLQGSTLWHLWSQLPCVVLKLALRLHLLFTMFFFFNEVYHVLIFICMQCYPCSHYIFLCLILLYCRAAMPMAYIVLCCSGTHFISCSISLKIENR